jgi:GxxExxY protein
LAIELTKQGLTFSKELEMPVYYDSIKVGTRGVDFLVADKIVVELKAITRLDEVHLSQALNYLEAYSPETGLLINFGSKSLEFRRVSNEYRLKRQQNASWLIQILL